MRGEPRLTVVVPTRNRPQLAVAAARSVREQDAEVRVVVSDNSADPAAAEALGRACAELPDVHYLRPPEPLPMSSHWEWAMEAARALTGPTHVTFLTDRMLFRPGALRRLRDHASRHPDRVLSYNHDLVDDARRPVRLFQKRGTGRVFRIPSRVLVERSARAIPLVYLPRLLNCVAPGHVLDAVRARFGSLLLSISPDFCFAFRCLAVVDEILYWDSSPLLQYGLDRSNGASTARGVASPDNADFLSQVQPGSLNHASPVPELRTVANGVVHEYEVVRRLLPAGAWPEIDRPDYLVSMASEVRQIESPAMRLEMERLLEREGVAKGRTSPLLVLRRLKRLTSVFSAGPLQPLWRGLGRRFGIAPPGDNALEFASLEEALEHGRRFPRRVRRRASHLRFLLGRLESADAPAD